ncbi:MAG: bifunctional folylpolyglutamate synthase/dihydrofolate synthase [Ilumatobacteraceae bacterium]
MTPELARALAYLDDHASYDVTGRIDSLTVEPIRRLCSAMGDPHLAHPVIHVTGTNGKGSTAQMITRLLMAQGLTVGTYTSPHLERVNERMRRNVEPITDEEFAEQIAAVAAAEAITGVRPTYFEAMTAAAFRWFADVAVDVAVVEVGMLGRWDATNIVESSVAVVTNIALDHTEFAGPTLVDIAREKAGIIKHRSAAIIGETDPELVDIFRAEGASSTLVRGDDFDTVDNSLAVGGRLLDLRTPTTIYSDVFVPLHGAHQGDNASVALAAVETFFAAPLSDDVVREGFGAVEVPGRFEVLGVQPLTVIDGAHNPHGADVCANVFFGDFQPDGRRILIIGTLRDPVEMVAAIRADEFDVVHVCTAPSPRGVPAATIARAVRELGCEEVYAHDTVADACRAAMRFADADDAILATGSIYVAGAAREPLRSAVN